MGGILILLLMSTACTKKEIVRVGVPFNDEGNIGVDFSYDITDSKAIGRLREIINKESEIEYSEEIKDVADVFISLDRPKENVSEVRRFIWFQDDGTSVLYSEGSDVYSNLTKNQTDELNKILVEKRKKE